MNISPVWKDVEHTFNSSTYTPYAIVAGNQVIFNGRAYPYPGKDTATIYVNHIVRDYLSSKIDYVRSALVHTQPNYLRSFTIADESASTRYIVYNDYGYDAAEIRELYPNVLSRPLEKVVDPRQVLFTTIANIDYGTTLNSSVETEVDGVRTTIASSVVSPCVTYTIPLTGIAEGTKLHLKGDIEQPLATYEVKQTCAEYCLYYLNAHGGFDHLLIKGNTLRTDAYTRTEIAHSVNNTSLDFARQHIATEVLPKWKLYTDYLTDEQWALTHHLLGSAQVYLHNFATNEIHPVVITANQVEFRTYANQGKHRSYLTIEVEASRKRIRK